MWLKLFVCTRTRTAVLISLYSVLMLLITLSLMNRYCGAVLSYLISHNSKDICVPQKRFLAYTFRSITLSYQIIYIDIIR